MFRESHRSKLTFIPIANNRHTNSKAQCHRTELKSERPWKFHHRLKMWVATMSGDLGGTQNE